MISDLIDTILAYIDSLKKEYGLYLTIHDSSGFLSRYMHRFVPYNIHSNPYCLCIKSNKTLWDTCIERQKKVVENCGNGAFFGMCYAGCEAYVVPITHGKDLSGFVSVSGYGADRERAMRKIARLCGQYHLDRAYLIETYDKFLVKTPPPPDFIQSRVTVICRLLELLRVKSDALYGAGEPERADGDYIFGHMLSYIEQNFRSGAKVRDIANACQCSVSFVNRLFRKRMGTSVGAYVNRLR
ncbi:MAG: hypothetical protein LBH54_05505, partial [Clostridiales bacterium]|nr:hypothetical protein [Clostridiales bacterium]